MRAHELEILVKLAATLDNHKFYEAAEKLTERLEKVSQNQNVESYSEFNTIFSAMNRLIEKGIMSQEQLSNIQKILFNS